MHVSWQEARVRASHFALQWAGEKHERAEKDSFWNDFLAIFAIERRQVARFEAVAQRYSTGRHGFIDLFWPGRLLVEHKSLGEDLQKALDQAHDYLPGMDPEDVPAVLVVCDFSQFIVEDLDSGVRVSFDLGDLPKHLEVFRLQEGRDGRHFKSQDDVNLAATQLLADFHDELEAMEYSDHHRRVLLTRVLFCLFADDAGVWPTGLFEDFIRLQTRRDGRDLGAQLAYLFQVLDTPDRSSHLPEEMRDFTYVNGGLFAEVLPIAQCNERMRVALLACCGFDWSRISPAIFGSMFQNVMSPADRRKLGAHYTSEANILKVIGPLFLDQLRDELNMTRGVAALRRYRDRLATLRFFDPACGCGNFLMVAYRELRQLELECLRRIRKSEGSVGPARRAMRMGQLSADVALESKVGVGQFYGIEIEEFPARIAETAMHLVDHLENLALSAEFGQYYARFPIADTAHVITNNALRMDWNDLLPAEDCTYLFGNPPFVGMSLMDEDQQLDRETAFAELDEKGSRTGRLDYVSSWYAKAFGYMTRNKAVRTAFVSTNSLTQGEQVRALGPLMLSHGLRIEFAHRTFAWTSEAKGKANVHVVIIGLAHEDHASPLKRLFNYAKPKAPPTEHLVPNINPYLVAAADIIPSKRSTPLVPGLPRASKGSQPTDGKHLLVTEEQYDGVAADPVAAKFLRLFRQGKDTLTGAKRWCLWLEDATPAELRSSPELRRRLSAVAGARRMSRTKSVQKAAGTPALFTQRRQPTARYLAMPEVSSENRRYIPAVFYDKDVIAGNKLITWADADLWLFGMLQSSLFTSWVGAVGGRHESRLTIAVDLTYCTFPFPDPYSAGRDQVEQAALRLLQVRAGHDDASLEDLYDPLTMPADLTEAHRELDRAVERQLVGRRLNSEGEQLAALFQRYEQLTRSVEPVEDVTAA